MQQGFTTISPGVLVSFGEGLTEVEGGEDPNVIIVCGWLGANLAHIEKYTKVYRERYPNATIFLLRSYHNFFWSSERTIASKIMPLVACLNTLGCIKFTNGRPSTLIDPPLPVTLSPLSTPRILLHSFSNGGSLNVVALAKLLSVMGCTPVRHISAMIIDSSPGGNFTTTKRAFSGFVKNPILKCLALVFIHIFYFSLYVRGKLLGHRSPFQVITDNLVKPNILPWMDARTPRLYVFSKTDELVPWEHVDATAKLSAKAGLDTRVEMYEDSPHVAHARTDPARYWGAIRRMWEAALRPQNE
ncbi:hypothetical protein PLEOSDRAFT_161078 [Pleurotus ostreatus PC15]|uniref:Uncharacterized protein n=1 Tax=Pleurotus ostreatus (strain PC15) TaxID=1137138 RepID=A0A067NA47_PLEO1|nr:hypothetical protein PLEOSDRAFT_161078 [Pleurotus ostreatus PC15]